MTQLKLIAVAGSSGSGKTTFSEKLIEGLGTRSLRISLDNYYIGFLKMKALGIVSFDDPRALDLDLLKSHLAALKRGEVVQIPIYSFNESRRLEETIRLDPKDYDFLILEGIFAFYTPQLTACYDTRIFVDTDLETCRLRRLARDVAKRGLTIEEANKQWPEVLEGYEKFVLPSREYADFRIDNTAEGEACILPALRTILDALLKTVVQNRYSFYTSQLKAVPQLNLLDLDEEVCLEIQGLR